MTYLAIQDKVAEASWDAETHQPGGQTAQS